MHPWPPFEPQSRVGPQPLPSDVLTKRISDEEDGGSLPFIRFAHQPRKARLERQRLCLPSLHRPSSPDHPSSRSSSPPTYVQRLGTIGLPLQFLLRQPDCLSQSSASRSWSPLSTSQPKRSQTPGTHSLSIPHKLKARWISRWASYLL